MDAAFVGDNVGFNIKGLSIKDINRGHVASNSKDKPADKVVRFIGQVIVLNHNNIVDGYTPVLDCHTAHIACKFNTIYATVDPRNGATKNKASASEKLVVRKNQACLVSLIPQKDMCVETFTEYAPLGRFAIRDMRRTVAVGVIKNIMREDGIGDLAPTGKTKKKVKGISALPFTRGDDFKWADSIDGFIADGHKFGDHDCTVSGAKVAEA
jgi:elongation factor 1-alpha